MTTIIAEIGHNGNGSMRLNKAMIEEAKECGADIAKFQYYRIDDIKKPYSTRYFELWAAQLSKDDLFDLKEHADNVGIEFMCSVFHKDLVKDLEEVGVNRYKIASRSIYDVPLIEEVLNTGKPVIASLGKWKGEGFPPYEVDYLYCVSDYPAVIDEKDFPFNLDARYYHGFSDHTIGLKWAKVAIDGGAKYVEKHFTLSRQLPGYNQAGSCEPHELKELTKHARQSLSI